ncbi:BON domain-containing protein [Pandoraea pnomenusa]|uniref:BON domain-containing protein n=1 Tax=Pandoraea pnomenusa TaxID=93220 RepID=UPI00334088A7
MAKRKPSSPALPKSSMPHKAADADERTQYEQHALTHEDGDAETNGAQAPASGEADVPPPHEARQSAARDEQTAQAQKQSDPAWLGASAPKRGGSKGGESSAGGHGYAPEIAHGKESGYGPADAAPGAHPRFGRQSSYGPHDDYAGTGRDATGHVPSARSPSTSRRVEWPEGTVGAQTSQQEAPADAGRNQQAQGPSGEAGQASGSGGHGGGGNDRGRASVGIPGEPQQTAHRSVHARSRGPSPGDAAVRDEIRQALRDAHDLDASHVDVTVTSGLVLLTGHVPERWMQHVVQTVVSKVPGVTGVDNQLHERRGKAMSRPGESQEGHKI